MAYVRIDDAAMDHPKILELSDAQLCLWLRGLCYCQKHLTDGFLTDTAIKSMRAKAGDAKRLCDLVLWEAVPGGFLVHDYLDWNDSRDMTVNRKRRAKDRQQAFRDQRVTTDRNALRDAVTNTLTDPVSHTPPKRSPSPHLTSPHLSTEEQDFHRDTDRADEDLSGTTDATIARRAGDFFREWERLFSEHRFGATYLSSSSQVDYGHCCRLVEKFTNPRLSDLAVVFLNSNEKFIESSNRSVPVFASRISWCDEQLRKAEASQRRSA